MRIAFSSFVLQGGKSGVSSYILGLIKGLQNVDTQNYYDVYVNRADAHLFPPFKKNFKEIIHPDFIAKPVPNIVWHNTALPFLKSDQGPYDIVHIPTIGRIPYFKRSKIIATIHDLAPMVIPQKYDRLHLLYHHHILSRIVHRCDHIIAVSQSTKNDIIRFTGYPEEKISLVYLGINRDFYHPIPTGEARSRLFETYHLKDPFLLYVSRIEHPGKNHIRLMQAFEQFKKKTHAPHHLVLAGADWNGAEQVHEYAQKSPLKDQIHLLGFVPANDVRDLYNTCDLLVFPSLYEGFGLPVLEAMACGAQVACSNTSALVEIAKGYADLFDPHQTTEIAKTIEACLTHPIDAKERKRRLDYASSYDWNEVAKKVVKIYESL